MKPLKKCVICGEEYDYCSSCPDKMNMPSWKNSFCSENCKKIYDACAKYNAGELIKEEANALLETCDLSSKSKFSSATKKLIKEITAKPRQKKEEVAVEE